MTAPARLLSIRLQGFKSFAERTHVEFGPGISAVVGPNGSGKSNLADALRWALGEQGRALRTRKAEDVIWAGSERRAAVGMADVQLSLDNGDGLLPVDYGVVELGRRLYRSGENEYLMNRTRVRLRDLVDLLEAAHLAENAFLFIGQGMVDQALALRPEERRPLFEEVAGVRRHDRRRRKAEEQLVESEANLARVEDILAELRPQVRRLAAQAEQQLTRDEAGTALARAILQSAAARWHGLAARTADAQRQLTDARARADAALAELTTAEEAVSAVSTDLAARGDLARTRRAEHDAALSALTDARLADGRVRAELTAIDRDADRIAAETTVVVGDLERDRRVLAEPEPARDLDAEAAAEGVTRALAEARAEVAALRSTTRAEDAEQAAVRRAGEARSAELETARRRLADAVRRAEAERAAAAEATGRRTEAEASQANAHGALLAAETRATELEQAETSARHAAEAARSARVAADLRLTEAEAAERMARQAVAAATARAADGPDPELLSAVERSGGRRLTDGLDVEPRLRAAVEAALGDLTDGVSLPESAIGTLDEGVRGAILVAERATPIASEGGSPAVAELLRTVDARGGGRLDTAVRRDHGGAVRFALRRTVWLPDLEACLSVQAALPPGWIAVTVAGDAVVGEATVRLGAEAGPLTLAAERTRLEADLAIAVGSREAATRSVETAIAALAAADGGLARTTTERRAAALALGDAEEADRAAARALDVALRSAAWAEAQAGQREGELARARSVVAELEAGDPGVAVVAARPPATASKPSAASEQGLATWTSRLAELEERARTLDAAASATETARREVLNRRARAEASVQLAEERHARLVEEGRRVSQRGTDGRTELARLSGLIEVAEAAEIAARGALEAVLDADAEDRRRLSALETAATAARGALREGDETARRAESVELEARLGLDALRDAVLVDIAALGPVGLAALEAEAGDSSDATAIAVPSQFTTEASAQPDDETDEDADEEAESLAFEPAFAAAAAAWAASPATEEAPSAGRLASLRRRFHELGAPNPYAAEEYREIRDRVTSLDAQDADLRSAIASTRALIEELDALISNQFETTFRALEAAFDRRFRQLFGGGYARLSLTDPDDLAGSGVDIVARPPGKKAQALAMLSGGERALTAVALLFAMLEVRPVPFCVLDEVDAALDEANIGRFTSALRELAATTQFVVITHNRGTIETADALYGVTVGDDSVSRVISLRLEEARALAGDEPAATDEPTAVPA